MPTKLFQWELIQFRDVLGRFTKGSAEARKASRQMAREAGQLVVRKIKAEAPIGTHYDVNWQNKTVKTSRPETLKKSIKFRTYNRPWGVELDVLAVKYAQFVIKGTKPHIIRPRKKKVLAFFWAGAPQAIVQKFGWRGVTFMKVKHPGTKANPFQMRGLKKAEPRLRVLMLKRAGRVKQIMEGT